MGISQKTLLRVKRNVSQGTNANEVVRTVSLIRTGFVLSAPQLSGNDQCVLPLSYSEALRQADPEDTQQSGLFTLCMSVSYSL